MFKATVPAANVINREFLFFFFFFVGGGAYIGQGKLQILAINSVRVLGGRLYDPWYCTYFASQEKK